MRTVRSGEQTFLHEQAAVHTVEVVVTVQYMIFKATKKSGYVFSLPEVNNSLKISEIYIKECWACLFPQKGMKNK